MTKSLLAGCRPLIGIALLLLGSAAVASPPPPAADPCSSLRIKDFSQVGDGAAPTKVMFGAMQKSVEISEQQAWQNSRRSRAMNAGIPDDITTLPDNCLVEGYVSPHIRFEMRLPAAENWNGKYLLVACDGWCGKIAKDATMAGVVRNYATMVTDGGHWGEHPFDGIWASDNTQAKIDFGYRANHVLPMAAKAIIKEYYGELPEYSYITGCSKGGQAGIMSALRYPGDFDGVLSRGPTIDYTRVNVLRCANLEKTVFDDDGKPRMWANKVPMLQRAVMDHCDETDGLRDRLISDPRKCDFDPASIQCGTGKVGPNCLTAEEVEIVRKVYAPVTDAKGEVIYPGTPYGSESSWPGWVFPVQGNSPIHGDKLTYAQQCGGDFLRYMAFRDSPGPGWDWRKEFDWDRDHHLLYDIGKLWDATNPDLRKFRDKGGKIIVAHGWADSAIPAEASIEWYDDVSRFMGGYDNTAEFARMFLLPGVEHCDGGPGPEDYDALALLEKWVEEGEAPDSMETRRTEDGELVRTRPVYPFPTETVYKGRGDIDRAENFEPRRPR
ncbi:MAG: tannase/feruloyl esterase family alpha/beta hydrolase [Proteobacteria bacterium]|nr:tannase/feruloyl esterase family alpha/beta hydrolase [Pseudomonadota bacterium]